MTHPRVIRWVAKSRHRMGPAAQTAAPTLAGKAPWAGMMQRRAVAVVRPV